MCLIGDSLSELELKEIFSFLKDNCERNPHVMFGHMIFFEDKINRSVVLHLLAVP